MPRSALCAALPDQLNGRLRQITGPPDGDRPIRLEPLESPTEPVEVLDEQGLDLGRHLFKRCVRVELGHAPQITSGLPPGDERGLDAPRLRVRAWPLELVNGEPHHGRALQAKVDALRADVAPDRFAGFNPAAVSATSMPAMASEAAAYRVGPEVGERFSLAVRRALFDDGLDVSDPAVLAA